MNTNIIPKVIHYCWFGRRHLPALAVKCIQSWRKYFPDYEIKEWNEDNFDVTTAPKYVQQAYERKRWAFVSDYVRLKALTEMGGVFEISYTYESVTVTKAQAKVLKAQQETIMQ